VTTPSSAPPSQDLSPIPSHAEHVNKAHRRQWFRQWSRWLLTLAAGYGLVAYLILPMVWSTYTRQHPAINASPTLTKTSDGHPGDPINVALIGTESELKQAMQAAGWYEADPLNLKDDVKIAEGTVLKRPYAKAPVSDLFLWGRKEDLAFEQPVGTDPRKRHHVRFWKSDVVDSDARPAWMGSATYDERVGLSYTTGQITHHIDAHVDRERDHLLDSVASASWLVDRTTIQQFQPTLEGYNGGGDKWVTDGSLHSAVLTQHPINVD
jgi:hypothetical protein